MRRLSLGSLFGVNSKHPDPSLAMLSADHCAMAAARGCGSFDLGLYHDDIGSAEREGTDEGSMVFTVW